LPDKAALKLTIAQYLTEPGDVSIQGVGVTPDIELSDLGALFLNCTLKRSPELSHTQALVDASRAIMEAQGVATESIRLVDHDVATGVWPDMTSHGWAVDDWPPIQEKVWSADILVVAGPIWLGDNSSVTKRCIERLYASSHELNEAGQYRYYGRVAGCLITGNEDGPIEGLKLAAIQEPITYLLYPARWFPSTGYLTNRFTAELHIRVPQGMRVFSSGATGAAHAVTLASGKAGDQFDFNWTKPGLPRPRMRLESGR